MHILALTVLARAEHAQALKSTILDGCIKEATSLAEGILAGEGPRVRVDSLAEIAQLCGDLMLAQDRAEEAEETYRQAVKASSHAPRGQLRVVSCRGTGFLSLYQHRFGTAASCFARIAEDSAATPGQKVEALCALALAQHGMGHRDRAMHTLDNAAERAAEAGVPELAMLVSLTRVELLTQHEIRAHDDLRDHVFWQLPVAASAPAQVQPLAAIESCLEAHGQHELVAQRLRHLRDLILSTCGDVKAQARLQSHLTWLRRADMAVVERQARIDTALVAVATRDAEFARALLEPLCARGAKNPAQRWGMELSYCLAKVCAMDGRVDEAMRHYQRYASESMQCVRSEMPAEPRRGQATAAAATKDAVEASLPAKYRRAYRYLLDHLDCAELSVHEIAEHMGVSERAVQLAFKHHLGMTPVEVIQRCRVERIRADLLREDGPEGNVIETAARWGIRNRSTLAASYRKYFRETPVETLARRSSISRADPTHA
jgi:AraC-like DNA-binding protein